MSAGIIAQRAARLLREPVRTVHAVNRYQYPIMRPAVSAVVQQRSERPPATRSVRCSIAESSRV